MHITITSDFDGDRIVEINEGDIIETHPGVSIEIGQNGTGRALINGTPDPMGFMPLPQSSLEIIARRKMYQDAQSYFERS